MMPGRRSMIFELHPSFTLRVTIRVNRVQHLSGLRLLVQYLACGYESVGKWRSDQQDRPQKRRSRARGLSAQKVVLPLTETAKCFRMPKQ